MKKIITLIMFFFIYHNSISQELLLNNKGEESLIGKINKQIEQKKITQNAKFFLNDKEINLEELNAINVMKIEDIIDVQFYDIDDAIQKYGENVTDGAVNIIPFTDETLSVKYYSSIKNERILETIKKFSETGAIDLNPLIILNGKPLRGEEISTKINEIKEDEIQSINLLNKIVGYKIYGIRAVPGVIIVTLR